VPLAVGCDHGVAGVVAAGEPDDVVDVRPEQVGNLAFALVAPLGADEHDRWHSLIASTAAGGSRSARGARVTRRRPNPSEGIQVYEVELLSLASEGDCGQVRTQVRACADALTAAGARARPVTATSDQEVDEVLARVAGGARLVVAAASDAQVRAVVRRMVRRWAPPPSRRPDDLPDGRTLPDLPPLAILSLD